MRATRFIAGDPLRALAALSILAYHAGFLARDPVPASWAEAAPAYGDALTHVLAALDAGLFVFFVLSGYLIAGPFVRAFVEDEPMPRVGAYLRNRALRIVPAFWAVVLLILIVKAGADSSPREVLAVLLFAQSYDYSELARYVGQAWTLHTEVSFYLFVPLCAAIVTAVAGSRFGRQGRVRLVLALCAAGFAASLGLGELDVALGSSEPTLRDRGWQTSLATMAWAFVPGVVLAVLEPDLARRLAGARERLALGLLMAGLAALALYAAAGDLAAFPPRPGIGTRLLLAAGAGLVVAAPLVLQWSQERCWRALDNRPLHWLGERSYGIYLVHQAVLIEMIGWSLLGGHARLHLLVVLAACLAVTIPLAALLHRLVERPFLDLRKRWRRSPAPSGA